MNQRLPIKQGRYGLLVSLSAVRTLVEEAAAPDSSEGFLPLRTAARLAGVPSHRITSWIRAGKVTIAIGPHGRLLRLVDVQAVADLEARERERDVDEEGTTQPVDRACLWPAGGRDERCDGHSAPSGTAPFMRKRREQRGRVVPRTVLIVDDDAAILDMIQVALDDEGYRTLSSRDGASLQSAHELQPDLILLDPWMRGMDGFEVSERVRSDPATAHIPIVAMSAHPRVRDLSWDLPVHDRLLKPFNLDDLLAKVARWAPSHAEKGK